MANKQKKFQEYPILNNAPIEEALLDIQVQLPSGKDINDLSKVYTDIKKDFPIEKKKLSFSGSFELKSEELVSQKDTQSKIDGYLYYSKDKNKVFQSRINGFTFNQHKPYKNWDSFKEDARKYWDLYVKYLEPISIKRIALRYINKIPLKIPFNPSKYFKTVTSLGTGSKFGDLDYDIINLFSQISIQNSEINSIGNITQGVENTNSDIAKYLFDIDVYKVNEFEEEEIWKHFEELRNFKNEIFFKSLTEDTIKLLK